MKKVTSNANNLEGQKMFQILSRAKDLESMGKKIIHFELGDPDFDTPREVIDEAYHSMLEGETHYTTSNGLLDLRSSIAEYSLKKYNFKPSTNQILIANGANPLIYFIILVCSVFIFLYRKRCSLHDPCPRRRT